jgi:hypothetical protein
MHVGLHYSQMHFVFDLHNRMDSFFSELVSYFSLNVKIAKPFGNALTTAKKRNRPSLPNTTIVVGAKVKYNKHNLKQN